MNQHGAFSLIADIRPGMQPEVERLLHWIDTNDAGTNSLIPFRKIPNIHFARFVLLHERTDAHGNTLPPALSFTTNYDLTPQDHAEQLVQEGGQGLWQLFSLCEGFPQSKSYDAGVLLQYLRTNSRKANTFYVGVGHRSVTQIRQEKELREAIECFADDNRHAFKDKDALYIRQRIIEFVQSRPEFAWASQPAPGPSFGWQLQHYGKLAIAILLVIVLSPILIPFLIIWLIIMLLHEISDKTPDIHISKDHIRELTDRENGIVQAQFSAVGNLKPGWFRLATVKFLLSLTNFLAPYLFSKGRLSGIPTVHFARWLIINEGRQMLFLSNYDGNSESYLRDFIHIAAQQLTLLFSHTQDYPKTYLLVFRGARDAKGFMKWARKKQIVTNVWYSANKDLSVKNVFNNSKVREGLYGELSEKEALKWLSKI